MGAFVLFLLVLVVAGGAYAYLNKDKLMQDLGLNKEGAPAPKAT